MLSVFLLDYSFTIKEGECLTDVISCYQRDRGRLNPCTFVLENHALGTELQIDYGKDIFLNKNYLPPDYFLTFKRGGKVWHFCMDAKYRNYGEQQMTKVWWQKDVYQTAWLKYFVNLGDDNLANMSIDGSSVSALPLA